MTLLFYDGGWWSFEIHFDHRYKSSLSWIYNRKTDWRLTIGKLRIEAMDLPF